MRSSSSYCLFLAHLAVFTGVLLVAVVFGAIAEAAEPAPMPLQGEAETAHGTTAQGIAEHRTGLLPTSFLYPVKEFRRNITRFFTFNQVKKAELRLRYASETLAEAVEVAAKNSTNQEAVTRALGNFERELEATREHAVRAASSQDNERIRAFAEQSMRSTLAYEATLERLEEGLPSGAPEYIGELREKVAQTFGETFRILEPEDAAIALREIAEGEEAPDDADQSERVKALGSFKAHVPENAQTLILALEEKELKRAQEKNPDMERCAIFWDGYAFDARQRRCAQKRVIACENPFQHETRAACEEANGIVAEPRARCGNNRCEATETARSCPDDCRTPETKKAEKKSVLLCNANGICDGNETATGCPKDCAAKQTVMPTLAPNCASDPTACNTEMECRGHGFAWCNNSCFRDAASCPQVPAKTSRCGDARCDSEETPATCALDCTLPPKPCEEARYCRSQTDCRASDFFWCNGACQTGSCPTGEITLACFTTATNCETQADCQKGGWYWCSGKCQTKYCPSSTASPALTSGSCWTNPALCRAEQECRGGGWYWCAGACQKTYCVAPTTVQKPTAGTWCGDGVCQSSESVASCGYDCGSGASLACKAYTKEYDCLQQGCRWFRPATGIEYCERSGYYAGDQTSCPEFAHSRSDPQGRRYCQLNVMRACDYVYPSYLVNGANYRTESCPPELSMMATTTSAAPNSFEDIGGRFFAAIEQTFGFFLNVFSE